MKNKTIRQSKDKINTTKTKWLLASRFVFILFIFEVIITICIVYGIATQPQGLKRERLSGVVILMVYITTVSLLFRLI